MLTFGGIFLDDCFYPTNLTVSSPLFSRIENWIDKCTWDWILQWLILAQLGKCVSKELWKWVKKRNSIKFKVWGGKETSNQRSWKVCCSWAWVFFSSRFMRWSWIKIYSPWTPIGKLSWSQNCNAKIAESKLLFNWPKFYLIVFHPVRGEPLHFIDIKNAQYNIKMW